MTKKSTRSLSARTSAAKILFEVLFKKRSLNITLSEQLVNYTKNINRGFIQELCYGVLRWHERLNAAIHLLMPKPLKPSDQDIHCLLLIGIYQLTYLQTKPHAAIYETAQAARELKKPWAVGLINGVLRNWQRQQATFTQQMATELTTQFSHPQWLIDEIKQAWPEQWQTILTANNTHAPLTLRINQLKISRDDYLTKLAQNNIAAIPTQYSVNGIQLITPQEVTQLPGYDQGEFSVQDEAAQLAVELLELAPHQRVLDACAAPGGKTTHILECEPNLDYLVAIDSDAQRLKRVNANLTRLQLLSADKIKLIDADAAEIDKWWDGQLFDRILLDAPCSATGVIRRHPDIKYLRKPSDIAQLNQIQLALITALWNLLKPNGILVYATCSIIPAENHLLLELFLQQHADATEIKVNPMGGTAKAIGNQILPGENNMDGFYYAKFRKHS